MNLGNASLLQLSPFVSISLLVAFIWTIFWKGLAFWRAARSGQKYWLVTFLIINNDLGIIEIVYLFWFAKKRLTLTEIKTWLPK